MSETISKDISAFPLQNGIIMFIRLRNQLGLQLNSFIGRTAVWYSSGVCFFSLISKLIDASAGCCTVTFMHTPTHLGLLNKMITNTIGNVSTLALLYFFIVICQSELISHPWSTTFLSSIWFQSCILFSFDLNKQARTFQQREMALAKTCKLLSYRRIAVVYCM